MSNSAIFRVKTKFRFNRPIPQFHPQFRDRGNHRALDYFYIILFDIIVLHQITKHSSLHNCKCGKVKEG